MARFYAFPLDPSPLATAAVVSKDCTATEETSLRLSLLPESARDVAENEEVWRIAQRGAFEPARATAFTSREVLAMSLPTELYNLLRSLSRSALRVSLLEILALVVEDEDPGDSLSAVLDSSTWHAVRCVANPLVRRRCASLSIYQWDTLLTMRFNLFFLAPVSFRLCVSLVYSASGVCQSVSEHFSAAKLLGHSSSRLACLAGSLAHRRDGAAGTGTVG